MGESSADDLAGLAAAGRLLRRGGHGLLSFAGLAGSGVLRFKFEKKEMASAAGSQISRLLMLLQKPAADHDHPVQHGEFERVYSQDMHGTAPGVLRV